jgi:prephenate dehydratase
MIVGYQGMRGSHTERAAMELLQRAGLHGWQLDPCITSHEVVARLSDGRVQLGVLAVSNAVAGEVAETADALRGVACVELARCTLPIVHCLYAREPMAAADVEHVYSHEQALRQCAGSLTRLCPGATLHAMEDTAVAARALAAGRYPGRAAVVCAQAAGEQAGLALLAAAIQDRPDNATAFVLLRRAP